MFDLLTKLHLVDLQEVDEETLDNASACLTGPLDDNNDNVGSSAADINSIAEERYVCNVDQLGLSSEPSSPHFVLQHLSIRAMKEILVRNR